MSDRPQDIPEIPGPEEALRDGIQEDDNPIPLWFTLSFYASILFAVIYIPFYILSDWSAAAQWSAEVKASEMQYASVVQALPTTNPYHDDATAVAEGEQIWVTTCAACHKPDGSGLVGPSLVDPYWKYGRDDEELFETVAKGRPLGMPGWGPQLGNEKIWKVLAYLETLPQSAEPGVGAPTDGTGDPSGDQEG